MKVTRLRALNGSICILCVSSVIALITIATPMIAHSQDWEDTLESELDEMSTGAPEAAPTEKSEGPSSDGLTLDDEEPLDISLDEPALAAEVPPEQAPQNSAETSTPTSESLAPRSDEPNEAFEARLAQIYSGNSDPVSDEKWWGLLGARASETYSVQAGDTLWDLSQTLFADGFYWSKLWAENPEIQNPHKISKGHAIRFIGGTEASPPEVRVVKDAPDQLTLYTQAAFDKEDVVPAIQELKEEELADIDLPSSLKIAAMKPNRALNQAPYYREDMEGKITQADLESGVVIEQSEMIPRPLLPPPSSRRRSVQVLPRSFRENRPENRNSSVTIEKRSNRAEKIASASVMGFQAFDSLPRGIGSVLEVEKGVVASIGQEVFIVGNGLLTPGSRVHTVLPRYDVKSRVNEVIGSVVEVGGVLRILELADERANLYRAKVVYAVNPVRVGSLVLAGDPPRVPLTTKGRHLTAELTVVGGGYSESPYHLGDGSVVFLETNNNDIRVGDVLAVQARRGERKADSIVPDLRTPIGLLKVFAVSGRVASAAVMLAVEDIRIGDRTGSRFPTRAPDLRIEAPRVTRLEAE